MALITSTTSLPCTGALMSRSIINEYHYDIPDMRYSEGEHLYYLSLSREIKHFLCAVIMAESCLISSDKREWNTAWRWRDGVVDLISAFGSELKCFNEIPYIETDIFTP